MEPSLFKLLMNLPLFQGMDIDSLAEIVTKVAFDFKKLRSGHLIAEQDSACKALYFILKGSVKIQTRSNDHHLILEESLQAPFVLQIESLFGLRTRYTHSFISNSNIQMFIVDKQDITKRLLAYDIFRFNLLNILSTKVQIANRMLWNRPSNNAAHRFVKLLQSRCIHPAGKKFLHGKMTTIATEIGETRLTTSRMLHQLENEGLIEIKRQVIVIPSFEHLIQKEL
ncbi:MAG: Crp/Fnr family transcriptional regulator [Bacteroidaceae bacterium]